MTMKRVALMSVVLTMMMGVAACGSDAKKSVPTTKAASTTTSSTVAPTTTTSAETENTDSTDATDPPEQLSDADFKTTVDDIVAGVADAKGVCELSALLDDITGVPDPVSPAQAKDAVRVLNAVFVAIADAAPAGQEKNAAAIREYASDFEAQVKAANYDPALVNKVKSNPAFETAMEAFQTASAEC